MSGSIDGRARGFDTLVVEGSHQLGTMKATGPDSGSVELDGTVIRYAGLEPIILSDVPNVAITGTSGDDLLVVEETADSYTVRATTGTLESVTFAKAGLESFSIDGLEGQDSITVDADVRLSGALTFTSESITVNPNRSIRDASNITLTSTSTDDGRIENVLANLGQIAVPFPVDLTGFYFAKPAALIDVTGATLSGGEVILTANATALINPESAVFQGWMGPVCTSNHRLKSKWSMRVSLQTA